MFTSVDVINSELIIYLQITLIFFMLFISSYKDVKFREVADKLWLIFAILGIILTLFYYLNSPNQFSYLIIFYLIITVFISWGLYILKLYGGADAKCLIVISIILPTWNMLYGFHQITAIVTLTNSLLVSLIVPLYFVIYNSVKIISGENIFKGFENESSIKKILAFIIGYRNSTYKKSHMICIEKNINGDKKFDFGIFSEKLVITNNFNTWVTFSIPFLICIGIGFIITIFVGDLYFVLLSLIF